MEDEELQVDPLFAGMTRTPTQWGIPFAAFVIEWLFVSLVFIISGNLLLILLFLPIHGVLYAISANDPGIFEDVWIWLITKHKCTNYKFWGSRSFSSASLERYKGWD